MTAVTIRGLTRTYPGGRGHPPVQALAGVELDVRKGELLVVVGPSGSGKTTLIRAIAGLETVDAGTIAIDGHDVTAAPTKERDVAMVFQDGALFPHLDVLANITFGLRARRMPREEALHRAREATALLGLDGLLTRRPGQLSGGERQRVALARAIVREPALFLLDEPLASLDTELRALARDEVRTVQRRLGVAMIYVTHDQIEAMSLGDRVAVLRAGRIVQIDHPAAIYDHPASPFVARLFGFPPMNLLSAPGCTATIGVRAEQLSLVPLDAARLRGRVELIEVLGADVLLRVRCGADLVLVRVERSTTVAVGDQVGLTFDERAVRHFDGED